MKETRKSYDIIGKPSMIGMLSGVISYTSSTFLILTVSGVGYKVFVAKNVFEKKDVNPLTLFIHTHIREDLFELYGFLEQEDLALFELLINVSGVGCKTALWIFSLGSRHHIIHAIKSEDVAFFTGVPRLGTKNTQKIIIELKNKLQDIQTDGLPSLSNANQEISQALKNFGYSTSEIQKALSALPKEDLPIDQRIKYALKYLAK